MTPPSLRSERLPRTATQRAAKQKRPALGKFHRDFLDTQDADHLRTAIRFARWCSASAWSLLRDGRYTQQRADERITHYRAEIRYCVKRLRMMDGGGA